MTPSGTAIIGTGFIGPVHVEAVRRLGRDVIGILGSTPVRSQEAAHQLHISTAYASLAELLADDRVTCVHVTSPNRHHFAQVQAILAAGKHVICEKPLAMNVTETAELVRLAAASGLVAAVNYNVRYYPLCVETREQVRDGAWGPIHHVTGSYMQDWLLYADDYNWRVSDSDGGALRAVADIGTHWLDLIGFITGLTVESVCADLATIHPTRYMVPGGAETFTQTGQRHPQAVPVAIATEDYGSILLRFHGGARGALTVSQVTAGRKNCIRFDLAASEASVSWDSEEPNRLAVGSRRSPNQLWTRDPSQLSANARRTSDYPGGHAEGFPDTFKQLFRLVYDAIDRGTAGPIPYPTFADGHREVLLCEAILRSARNGQWTTVSGE